MGLNTSFSPDKIKYIFDYLAGGLGRDVVKGGELISRVATGNADEITARSIPVIGTFVKEASDYEDRFEFYDNYTFIRQVKARYKAAQASADTAEIARLNQEYKHYRSTINMHQPVEKTMRAYAKYRKTEERLNTNEDLRKKNIENALTAENKLIDAYNKAFREAARKSK